MSVFAWYSELSTQTFCFVTCLFVTDVSTFRIRVLTCFVVVFLTLSPIILVLTVPASIDPHACVAIG